ncbi:hypothetical protein F9U64_19140 [Gracilibacillus oryzae]|uniref:Uncharacterized protein n=1 Tax=Gracilibacillus oryzae TaxID=1672701 RepID=A0A7C8GQR9_9BACI|nr:hypothetical protein [Gracilibacillus oryzae]KAB8126934.1 hypothetical protein F9U64_19140 [Gracilibacillus oryzae]
MTQTNDKLTCIKCGFEPEYESAEFCMNCGYELDSNYCTNDHCMSRNNGERIPLPSYACFCDGCGSESTYYLDGFISPSNVDRN